MKKLILSTTVLGCLLALSGCLLQDQIFGHRGDLVRGRVTFGFEEAGFRPCNSDEQWWVVGDEGVKLQEKWSDLGLEWYQPGYAEVRGDRSGLGEYGHLGAYQRELDVKEVREVRLLKDGECPWPKTER